MSKNTKPSIFNRAMAFKTAAVQARHAVSQYKADKIGMGEMYEGQEAYIRMTDDHSFVIEVLQLLEEQKKELDWMREKVAGCEEALKHADILIARIGANSPAEEKKVIGWRSADYTMETTDLRQARNWALNFEVLPVFEGDVNSSLEVASA